MAATLCLVKSMVAKLHHYIIRGVEYTLQLLQVDVVHSNQNAVTIVELAYDQSID